jgi:DNA-binding NtrC family response regulator
MIALETIEIDVIPAAPQLEIEVQENGELRRIPVSERPLVLGSTARADVRISDPTISARHCTIAVHHHGIHVADLGSRNGTWVAGARVREGWAGPGSAVLVGKTAIVCIDPSKEPSATGSSSEKLGPPLVGVAGGSAVMRRVANVVRRLAAASAPVLITGETGSGKELIARALHLEGPRKANPFVALNVAALPRELVESELFGHERGAFTGATTRRDGAFADAEGGTLFLDEIGELPIDAQPKLLRALDGYEVRRIGAAGSGKRTDVRVVAATHAPLYDHVKAGHFRRDLFHRLEVFVIELPPLRARVGDIHPISSAILGQLAEQLGEHDLTPAAIAQLAAHDWPGNVRELRNVLIRAAELSKSERWIDAPIVQRAMRQQPQEAKVLHFTPEQAREWLENHEGNVSAAARAARMPRTTFRKLLAKAK